jgi:FMN phosphatase YigB (HAD superfamily)
MVHTARLRPTSRLRSSGTTPTEPEAFRRLATRLACAPDEILYFDDDAAYVAGAREAGLSTHRVGGAAGVRTGLAVHGLERW